MSGFLGVRFERPSSSEDLFRHPTTPFNAIISQPEQPILLFLIVDVDHGQAPSGASGSGRTPDHALGNESRAIAGGSISALEPVAPGVPSAMPCEMQFLVGVASLKIAGNNTVPG
ncbi:hypothetical protein FRB90_001628 [Tulasnella sp. 427]|nr:hypothetical protein FRB90_001628 [Tulasnella sp. 427]